MQSDSDFPIHIVSILVRADFLKETTSLGGTIQRSYRHKPIFLPEKCVFCGNSNLQDLKEHRTVLREFNLDLLRCKKDHINEFPTQFTAAMKNQKKSKLYSKKKLELRERNMSFEFDRGLIFGELEGCGMCISRTEPQSDEIEKTLLIIFTFLLARVDFAKVIYSENIQLGHLCTIKKISLQDLAQTEILDTIDETEYIKLRKNVLLTNPVMKSFFENQPAKRLFENAHMAWQSNVLDSTYANDAIKSGVDGLMLFHSPLKNPVMDYFLKNYQPRENEFFIADAENDFVLTNQRLILSDRITSEFKSIELSEIVSFRNKNSFKTKLLGTRFTVILKNNTEMSLELIFSPNDELFQKLLTQQIWLWQRK